MMSLTHRLWNRFIPIGACLVAFVTHTPFSSAAERPDIVLADFEGKDYGPWKVEGQAFGPGPAQGTSARQRPASGYLGHGLVNSGFGGDGLTGKLTSPEFVIDRRFISFLIGGGGFEGKTCINLVVAGKVARSATGPNTRPGGSAALEPDAWDVKDLAGQTARIEIVDDATGGWGHIKADQIVLSDRQPAVSPRTVSAKRAARPTGPGEVLYNGIRLPGQWPPMIEIKDRSVQPLPPYLVNPPAVIPIDVGRQLFVDDFLVDETNLKRQFHYPERYRENPILKPETPTELNGGDLPLAAMISDGVCYDPQAREFKLWYQAGWRDGTMLATSKDGLHWTRPALDVEPGTNRVLPKKAQMVRHGTGIAIDPYTADPRQRFKMLIYENDVKKTSAYLSPDGIHWDFRCFLPECGDNSTPFYNPFRNKWVISIRLYRNGRARNYYETADFLEGIPWDSTQEAPWANADELDTPDPGMMALLPPREEIEQEAAKEKKPYDEMLKQYRGRYGDPTQLYNLDAVAYESLMLGVFGILRGPTSANTWDKLKVVKLIDLELAYSRDGFHWYRPDRTPFLASTRKEGDWDRGYLHSGVGICTVVGDKLHFYYSGWSGISPKQGKATYAGGATGVAFLRRDGFASMDAGPEGGTLTTRPVTFKGKHLFVNLDAPQGELRVEVLDEGGKTIAPFTAENCIPVSCDKTRQQVTWKGADDLSQLAGRRVKFRFHLRQGRLYAFWVTPDAKGASYGYVAAGGPDFNGPRDVPPSPPTAQAADDKNAPNPVYDIDPAEAAQNQHYRQPYRPQFHYAPMQGHVGDATGLIYYQGQYHLFYMSDKWERRRNRHKCWGHAISRDCLHWEEQPSILDPVLDHKPGSGSGIVDWNNTLGLATGLEKTLAVFYTDYKTGSCIAYSTDSGRNWTRHPRNPVLPGPHDARDPLVFWHAPSAEWRMVRFDGRDGFEFYASNDLLTWSYLSRVVGFNECPDFFELPVEGSPGERKWVLMDAGFSYMLGSFDGRQFKPETEKLRVEWGYSANVYAPQTWKIASDGSKPPIQMGFLRYPLEPRLTWHDQMTFPCELRLRRLSDGVRLCRLPIPEIDRLHVGHEVWRDLTLKPGENPLADLRGDLLNIRAEIELSGSSAVSLEVRGQPIAYSAKDQRLQIDQKRIPLELSGNRLRLQVLVDRSSLEVYAGEGQVSVSKAVFFDPARADYSLTATRGSVRVISLQVNRLKSIWPEAETRRPRLGPA